MLILFWIYLDILLVSACNDDNIENGFIKYDPVRYHVMVDEKGVLHYVDLWYPASQLKNLAEYNPDKANTYHLYTRKHKKCDQVIVLNDLKSLKNSDFNPRRRTVVLVHGWTGSYDTESMQVMIPAFLKRGDYNVIVVDWSDGADTFYFAAVRNTPLSGKSVARFIDWVCKNTGAKVKNFHLVGFSLGGQQVGIIGRYVKGNITHINALDPAGPGWYTNSCRLKATDAKYTEAISTNANYAGYPKPLAHVTFYPNGGITQPGCFLWLPCCHQRAYQYYTESLLTGGFTSVQCESYVDAFYESCHLRGRLQMGGLKPKFGKTGFYYLKTNSKPPFSLG